MSHENFARERSGVLQMLRPGHDNAEVGELIRVLGGSSGRDVDKRVVCANLGYTWGKLIEGGEEDEETKWPLVLPSCIYYLKLEMVGDLIDCGSHDVALCKVVSMISGDEIENAGDELNYISTRNLREMGIISEFGRVIPLKSDA